MGYRPSRDLKHSLGLFSALEAAEDGSGYVLLSFLALLVGAFFSDLTRNGFWLAIFQSLLEAFSKKTRASLFGTYFAGLPCAEIVAALRLGYRVPTERRFTSKQSAGAFRIFESGASYLGGSSDNRNVYELVNGAVRAMAVTGHIIVAYFLYQEVLHFRGTHTRMREVLRGTCLVTVFHCALSGWVLLLSFPVQSYQRTLSSTYESGKGSHNRWRSHVSLEQGEAHLGLTWYIHVRRHWWYNAAEAQTAMGECGLPAHWFLGVGPLLQIVRLNLHDLSQTRRAGVEGGGEGGQLAATAPMTMAMASLEALASSKGSSFCDCEVFWSRGQSPGLALKLPQVRRCRTDMEAARDFAANEGFLTMIRVINFATSEGHASEVTKIVNQAMRILAGFAASLSCLVWQPAHTKFAIGMLGDDNFHECTRKILQDLFSIMEKGPEEAVVEAILYTISSFYFTASEVYAHLRAAENGSSSSSLPVSAPKRLWRSVAAEVSSVRYFLGLRRVWVTPDPDNYSSKLNNRYTTACPVGAILESIDFPVYSRTEKRSLSIIGWLDTVNSALGLPLLEPLMNNPSTSEVSGQSSRRIDILLNYALDTKSCPYISAHSIDTLASLWSSKMIYWHRFEKRTPPIRNTLPHLFLPPPLHIISPMTYRERPAFFPLPVSKNYNDDDDDDQSIVLRLRALAKRRPMNALSKLQVARILIAQQIGGADEDIVSLIADCLQYWKQVLALRVWDWFACEAIETLRDLLETVRSEKARAAAVVKHIEDKVGLDFLVLILRPYICYGDVTVGNDSCPERRERAVLKSAHSDFTIISRWLNRCFRSMFNINQPNEQGEYYPQTDTYSQRRCVAAAAGLLADMADIESSFVTRLIIEGRDDTATLRHSLLYCFNWILSWQQDLKVESDTASSLHNELGAPPSLLARARSTFVPMMIAGLYLGPVLFWLGPLVQLYGHLPHMVRPDDENCMGNFADIVNCRLAVKHVTRIIEKAWERYEPDTLQALPSMQLFVPIFPKLVNLLVRPYPAIPRKMEMDETIGKWDDEIRDCIMSLLTKLLHLVVMFFESVKKDIPCDLPDLIRRSVDELERWASDTTPVASQSKRRTESTVLSGGDGFYTSHYEKMDHHHPKMEDYPEKMVKLRDAIGNARLSLSNALPRTGCCSGLCGRCRRRLPVGCCV